MHRHMNRSMALYFIHLMIPTTWKKWLHFDKVRLRQSFELDMQLRWTSFRLLIVLSLFTFWISQPPALVSWRIQPSGPFRDFDRRDATASWSLSMDSMEWRSCRLRGGTDSERRRRRLRVRLCRSKRTGGAVCVCVTSLRSPWSYSTGHEPWTGDWECSTREIGLKGAARIRELQINLYAHSNPLSAQIEESCCITKWKQASDSSPDLSQFHVA